MKVSDYIAKRLVEFGIERVYMITGGGAMHLNDSFAHTPGMSVTYNHHEQACAIAAEGYFRSSGKVACVNVTTGPGGLNTLTGVMGQWTDSIPAIYVSGQVKFETTISSCPELGLRQLGDQEVDIVSVVSPLVKYAVQLRDVRNIGYEIEKAFKIATTGRFGPVWIDVPMNIQGAQLDEHDQRSFESSNEENPVGTETIATVAEKIRTAKRPVIIAGHGIRLANAKETLKKLTDALGIPLLTTFNNYDIITDDDPSFVGRVGTIGSRAGNFALQNADLLLCIGTRNNIRQISYNWENFGHRAYKIAVDIDPAELRKPTFVPDLPIEADAKVFMAELEAAYRNDDRSAHGEWMAWCRHRREKYPVVLEEYRNLKECIHPYVLIEMLTSELGADDFVISANGTAIVALFQASVIKKGVRIIGNSGTASMGYELPAAIGAADATSDSARIICVAGDGSAQMNLQELITLQRYGKKISIFYLNNNGYISIKQTQDGFFSRRAGCDPASGVPMPDMSKIAPAYGYEYVRIDSEASATEAIAGLNKLKGPGFFEVVLPENYVFAPKLSSARMPDGRMVSKPLEDLSPFLSAEELESNMIRD